MRLINFVDFMKVGIAFMTAVLVSVVSIITPSTVNAGPRLYFGSGRIAKKISSQKCVSLGYSVLSAYELQPISGQSGYTLYALASNQDITAIIDCTLSKKEGKVTVMASSSKVISSQYVDRIYFDLNSAIKGEKSFKPPVAESNNTKKTEQTEKETRKERKETKTREERKYPPKLDPSISIDDLLN